MNRLQKKILRLKEEKRAYILAHFYQRQEVQAIADEVGEALKTAWTELKKGWKEVSAASSDSFEWIKENTKDARESFKGAIRDFGDSVRSMMNDMGDAGDTEPEEEESCETADEPARSAELNIEWAIPEEEEGEEAKEEQ